MIKVGFLCWGKGVVDELMTHLFLLQGAVCAGTDVLADVGMDIGAVGAAVVVVALLESLFSCTFVLLVLWDVYQKMCVCQEC